MTFFRGVAHALDGIRVVLVSPRLWPYVLLPFLLSVAAFVALIFLVVHFLGWAWALAVPVAGLFLFLPVASLLAAPFNEEIAEAVEVRVTGREPPPFSFRRFLRDLGMALVHEARKFLRWALLSAAVLALSLLLPVVGSAIGLAGGFVIAAHFAAYDCLDATASRWGWSYAQKRAFLREHRGLTLGLGATVAVLLMVPFVNAVALPLGCSGGSLLLAATRPPT